MSYREENGQVVLTMSKDDHDILLMCVGAGTQALGSGLFTLPALLEFVNRLQEGNPHFIPYQTGKGA